jgi:CRISPR system Cascade subunit CasA
MNLTTEPWIPIVWNNGKPGTVSLREAFERGEEIRDLAVRPHERIALMRLLICIAQAALDGPADCDDWKVCQPRIAPLALEYLNCWRHAFELFGNGQRFLQVTSLKKPSPKSKGDDDDEGNSTSKLDLALATGNNTTLFDNAGGSQRTFTPAELALMLTTFQCFSPCGTIGVALWNGNPTLGWNSYPKVKPGQSAHAPCISGNMLHSYLRGRNLLDSLHCNLITKEQVEGFCGRDAWGKPEWESVPLDPTDKSAAQNASKSYLGRLVPLSRAVQLAEDLRSMTLANGLEYPSYPEWREASATVVTVTRSIKKEPARVTLQASVDKDTWRELHALTVIAVDKNTNGGPVALRNLKNDEDFDLWVGGLVAAGNGKLVDSCESVFHIPATMLKQTSQMVYEEGVRLANTMEFGVRKAVSVYYKELGDHLDRPEMRSRRQQIQSNATAQFWTDIESAVPGLLEVAASPESLGLNHKWHGTVWGRSVWRAARAAYERACPHDTPRQIRAYALGLKTLFAAPAESPQVETEKEVET